MSCDAVLSTCALSYVALSHPIYKWQANQRRQAEVRPRSASFSTPSGSAVDPAFEHIHEPGGFRRNYVIQRANEQGTEEPPMLNNFIEFLYIFGHFVSCLETREAVRGELNVAAGW